MELDKLHELVKTDDGQFDLLAKDYAEQAQVARNLTDRSKALLHKKMNLNIKLGIESNSFRGSIKEKTGFQETSEMAKHQAKEKKKRNSIRKKSKQKIKGFYEKKKHLRSREWSREKDWNRDWEREKGSDRRVKRKQKFNNFSRNEHLIKKMNTSKILKIEGKKVRVNLNESSRFVLNRLVDLYENQFIEFKRLKGLHLQMILNYICGFLNSFGGSLYIGIADDGYVKGITLSRQDIDQFQVDLDRFIRMFHPRVFPDQIQLYFHEIALNSRKQVIV